MNLKSLRKFNARLGAARCFCSDSEAPDYTPVANASKESAEIMAALGREQLDFSKRQYDENKPLYDKIVQGQIDTQNETLAQGRDYYDYMVKNQRPVEDALNKDAMSSGDEAAQERAAGKAAADVRQGTTASQNQAIRQGLRYGFSSEQMGEKLGDTAHSQGLTVASEMNKARDKEKSLGYAKKLDVAGLYRGLPGASTAAYQASVGAGNAAGANAGAAGAQYMQGQAQGANTIGAGRTMYQSGLSNVLNSQTSVYNADQASGLDIGGLMSGAASLYSASDRRLKENIEAVGVDEATGLNLYAFNYIGDERRFVGVMADEVEAIRPDAVVYDDMGFAMVDYDAIGIEMKEIKDAA